jgi:hypothetical protein
MFMRRKENQTRKQEEPEKYASLVKRPSTSLNVSFV